MTEAFSKKQTMILLQETLLFIKTTPNFYLLTVIHEGIVKIGKQIIVSNIFITFFLSNTSSFVSVWDSSYVKSYDWVHLQDLAVAKTVFNKNRT